MANLILNQNYVQDGVGTLTYTIPSDGIYNVAAQTTVTPPSGLSIVVNQNGSPVYTAPVVTPTQSALEFKTRLVCAAADVITVVFASTTPVDLQLNSVKSNLSIGQGA